MNEFNRDLSLTEHTESEYPPWWGNLPPLYFYPPGEGTLKQLYRCIGGAGKTGQIEGVLDFPSGTFLDLPADQQFSISSFRRPHGSKGPVMLYGGLLRTDQSTWMLPPDGLGEGGSYINYYGYNFRTGIPNLLKVQKKDMRPEDIDRDIRSMQVLGYLPFVPHLEYVETLADGRKVLVLIEPPQANHEEQMMSLENLTPSDLFRLLCLQWEEAKQLFKAGVVYGDWQGGSSVLGPAEEMILYGTDSAGKKRVVGHRITDFQPLPVVQENMIVQRIHDDIQAVVLGLIPDKTVGDLNILLSEYNFLDSRVNELVQIVPIGNAGDDQKQKEIQELNLRMSSIFQQLKVLVKPIDHVLTAFFNINNVRKIVTSASPEGKSSLMARLQSTYGTDEVRRYLELTGLPQVLPKEEAPDVDHVFEQAKSSLKQLRDYENSQIKDTKIDDPRTSIQDFLDLRVRLLIDRMRKEGIKDYDLAKKLEDLLDSDLSLKRLDDEVDRLLRLFKTSILKNYPYEPRFDIVSGERHLLVKLSTNK